MELRSPDANAGGPPPERARTVDLLCEAFADDRIGLDEFERRVALAHAATSASELDHLLADLPSPTRAPARRAAPHPSGSGASSAPASREASRPGATPGARGRDRGDASADQNVVVGFMGGAKRRGPWATARINWAIAVMGGVELDLRDALLAPGVTEVKVLAFWGGVEIVVPPHVRVECSGVGIMGGFDHDQTDRSSDDPDAPVVRVGGWAIMGGIEVTVRRPGESPRSARRRLRNQRRALQGRSDPASRLEE